MELHDCIDAMKKYILLIATTTVLFAAVAGIVSQCAMSKEYESSATVVVTGKGLYTTDGVECEYNVLLEKNLIKVFYNISQSDAVLKKIIWDLNLNITEKELRRIFEIDFDAETGVIRISAETSKPGLSRDLVYGYIVSLDDQMKYFISRTNLHIIDAAKLSVKPSGPNTLLNMILSAAAGAMFGILAAILLTAKAQTRFSIFALDKLPELYHIGSVPVIRNLRNQKAQPVFSNSSPAYESLKGIRTNLLYLLERDSVNTIMVTSPRESEGKTTMAVNIASSFAQFDHKVLLIDCNFKKPALSGLISDPEEAGFEIMIPQEHPNVDFTLLASMIETMKADYDLIILDCPPVLNSADTQMLSYIAKNAVIVADYRRLSHWVIKKSVHSLTQINSKVLGIILNRVPKGKIM